MYRNLVANLERVHYWGEIKEEDEADLYSVTYRKQLSATGVRVTSSGGHRVKFNFNNSKCSRW